MAISWIPHARVSMQRAGMLAATVAVAPDRQPASLERVAQRLLDGVSRRIPVPEDHRDDALAYLRSLRLWKRYGRLRDAESLGDADRLEAQDVWLADPELP